MPSLALSLLARHLVRGLRIARGLSGHCSFAPACHKGPLSSSWSHLKHWQDVRGAPSAPPRRTASARPRGVRQSWGSGDHGSSSSASCRGPTESTLKLLQGAVALRWLHLCAEVSGRGALTAWAAAGSMLCLPRRPYAACGSHGFISCLQHLATRLLASEIRAVDRGAGLLTSARCMWMLGRMCSQHALSITAYS